MVSHFPWCYPAPEMTKVPPMRSLLTHCRSSVIVVPVAGVEPATY